MTAARPRRTTMRSVPATGAPAARLPFVGRDADLFTLAAALPGAGGHGPRLRLVGGEPGIGKSRLVRQLAEEARRTGHRVVWAQVWQGASTPPYWPWTQIVRELLGRRTGVDLAALVLDEDHGAVDRFELFDATAAVIADAARRTPLLVVVDDLHDADPASLLLLHFAAAHLREEPVLVVGTYREADAAARPEVADQIEALADLSDRTTLAGLDGDALVALGVAPGDVERVLAATGGNPLYVEQVLLHEQAMADASPADALRTVLDRRLARLSSAGRHLLAARAVLGPGAPHDDVVAVAGVPRGEIAPALDEAVAADLLADPGGWFPHALVADAAERAVDGPTLAAMHRRAADLVGDPPERAAERARHLLRAGAEHWRDAVDACRRAATVAHRAMASEEAVGLLRRAWEVVVAHDTEAGDLAFEVAFDLAGAEMATAGRAAAEPHYGRAWELAVATDDPVTIARAAARHTIQFFFSGDVAAEHGRQVRRALELATPAVDTALRARLHAALATAILVEHPDGAVDHAAVAVDLARTADDPVALGQALVAEQVADLGPRTLVRRLATAREIIALAESSDERDLLVHGRFLLMAALLERGDVGALDAQLSVQHDVIDTVAAPRFARHALWFRTTRAMLDGDAERVIALAESCYALAEALGDPDGPAVFWGQVGVARWMQGRVDEMEPAYVEQRRAEPDAVVWKAVLAWLAARAGRLDAARGILAEVPAPKVLPHDQATLLTLATLAETAVAVDDPELGTAVWEELLPYADHVVPIGLGAATWGTVARPLGALAIHLGHVEEGLAHLAHAIEVSARLGARPWLTEAQLDLAEALVALGRTDDPRLPDLVAEAADTVERCGLRVFDERVDALTAIVVPPTPRTADDPSTEPGAPTARVAVLGTFEVVATDGTVPRWTSRKARELLKILVARRGAPVPREEVMDLLWPDEDPSVLANRLSVALSTVRRSLDPGRGHPTNTFVAADGGALRLVTAHVDVDAERFLDAADEALDAVRRNDPAATELLHAARRARSGPAMPDEPYASWADGLRREVDAATAAVLRCAAQLAEEHDDHLVASEAHRDLLDLDPYDEGAHRGLIGALRALGAHGQADAAATAYRRAMDEIGVPVVDDP
ncbi:AAA family ATPase [Actinomarinicola tropica]|uniref:AAA family ATPase n=1 Tax=Actinomarinicola tropica TaxID=2789776 RepID=A0A5Q2RKP6_9ACTN|nr:AAA family ATPase [Actinomarinicola tropica]QGG94430.1 AAA family ATPase [Actinomarinicola tropica]